MIAILGVLLLNVAANQIAVKFTGHGLMEILGWPLFFLTYIGIVLIIVGVAKGFKDE